MIHDFSPVLIDFGYIQIRWYSLAYILGILTGWWYGKIIIRKQLLDSDQNFYFKNFDDSIIYIIIGVIVGGRLGYVIFYNLGYYISNPFNLIKVWEGGMSFHGALIGVIIGTYLFSVKRNIHTFFFWT